MDWQREYTINLRKGFIDTPRYKRAKKAVNYLKRFVERHAKVNEVKISKKVNNYIWSRGIKNPPPRIRVVIIKEEGIARVVFMDELKKKEEKVEKKVEEKKERKKEEKKEDKKESKEEVKEEEKDSSKE